MIDPLWSAMENFQIIFPIVFFFAFIRFLHNGVEIALITIIYEMSALPLHCCRSGNLAEWREWVVFTRTVFAYISHYETSTFGQLLTYKNDQRTAGVPQPRTFV